MPPKRTRETLSRQVASQPVLAPDVIAKRTKRHLDELERSNYAEPSNSFADLEDGEDVPVGESGKNTKGRTRQAISDKRAAALDAAAGGKKRKKSSMNIRTALLYRKNLTTLIEESGIADFPPHIPTYLTAAAAAASTPPRLICSVCGYWGRYKCLKCAMPYCDLACQGVHTETRCEKRVV